ncbi:MAG: hypothetical protein U1E10_02460 [Bdellovibrionales bacterium]|nr:hypothetical protein [Bdellovibrionales bacterium]
MKVMTLIQLSLCLLVGLPYSAAIANTESENHAQIVAKEIAALQSLKYGLDLQVSQLRKAHEVKMSLKNSQLQKLESELARLHVEVDEAQSRFDENEKKSKALNSGGGLESATKDLRKTLEAFEARSRKTAYSIDSMRAFRDEASEVVKVLSRSNQVREEAGAFKLKDGTVTQGGLLWLGETAVFGKSESGLIPLGPDGVGGWLAAPKAVVFSDLRSKVDLSTIATTSDRLAGFIPIFWLALLGMAVSWLFVSIAKQ